MYDVRRIFANRKVIILAGILLVLLGVAFLLFGQSGAPDVEASTIQVKQYTSIEIQDGDTLWDLAEEYGQPYHDRREFIKEVKSINRLYGDQITAGGYLLVPVYR